MVMTTSLKNYSDVHYTRQDVARTIIDHYQPSGVILEPFKGSGVFLNELPEGALWCEIEEGRDFFKHTTPVDWIVTNPPFSNLTDIMAHAFSIAQNTVFLVPISKITSSAPRLKLVHQQAGIKHELHFGAGRSIGFGIGFTFAKPLQIH